MLSQQLSADAEIAAGFRRLLISLAGSEQVREDLNFRQRHSSLQGNPRQGTGNAPGARRPAGGLCAAVLLQAGNTIAAVAAGQLNSARQRQADKGLFHHCSWPRSASAFLAFWTAGAEPRWAALPLCLPDGRTRPPYGVAIRPRGSQVGPNARRSDLTTGPFQGPDDPPRWMRLPAAHTAAGSSDTGGWAPSSKPG